MVYRVALQHPRFVWDISTAPKNRDARHCEAASFVWSLDLAIWARACRRQLCGDARWAQPQSSSPKEYLG